MTGGPIEARTAWIGLWALACTPGPPPLGDAGPCDGPAYGGARPDADAVFVQAGAPQGGDGSMQLPLRGLGAGVAAAVERGAAQVLLGAGHYAGGLQLGAEHDGLHIVGLCPEVVTVGRADDPHVAFWLQASAETRVHLSGMRVVDNPFGAVFVEIGRAEVSNLVVEGVHQGAFFAHGPHAALSLEDVEIAGMRGKAGADPSLGVWLAAHEGARLEAQGLDARDAQVAGLFVSGPGTDVQVRDSHLEGVRIDPEHRFGYGAQIDLGARLRLEDTVLSGTDAVGLFAQGAGTSLELVRSEVRDAGRDPARRGTGFGIQVDTEARLLAEDVLIAGAEGAGLHLDLATAALERMQIEGVETVEGEDGPIAYGLFATNGAALAASELSVQDSVFNGLTLTGAGTRAELRSVEVQRISMGPDGAGGTGLVAIDGASVEIWGARLMALPYVALVGDGANTWIGASDVLVADVGFGPPSGLYPAGVYVQAGAQLALTRSVVERSHGAGVVVIDGGAHAELADVRIQDMLGDVRGEWGRGIVVQGSPGTLEFASLSATDVVVERAADLGISAIGSADVRLDRVSVLDTRREAGIGTSAGISAQYFAHIQGTDVVVSGTEGPGIYAVVDGRIECAGCSVLDNRFAGVVVFEGQVRLSDSVIEGTASDANEGGGVGVFATAKVGLPEVVLDRVEIGAHPLAAVWLVGAGRYQIRDSVLAGGPAWPVGNTAVHGNGLMAIDGVQAWDPAQERGLWLRDTEISGAEQVGAFFHDATGTLDRVEFTDNGTDVWQQDCSAGVLPPEGLTPSVDAVICPEDNALIWPIDFEIFLGDAQVQG